MPTRLLADRAGGFDAALDLDGETAFLWLAEILEQKEIEAWKQSMTIWASRTANADGKEALDCMPPKPLALQDIFGE